MLSKITKSLIAEIAGKTPPPKPYDINDTELRGFIARVQATGRISYMISYRWQGKRNCLVVGHHPTITTAQARDKAREILAGKELGADPAEKKKAQKAPISAIHTLRSFIEDEYGKWFKAHHKTGEATVQRLKSSFVGLLDTPLPDITPLEIERWRTAKLDGGTKTSSVNRDLNSIKSLFTTAEAWGMAPNNLRGVKRLHEDILPKVRYLDNGEEQRLLDALGSRERELSEARERGNKWREERGYGLLRDYVDPLTPMVLVSLHTGIRWGELVQLDYGNIDLSRRVLTVKGETAKSAKTRHIPLNARALDALKKWQKDSERDKGLVFPGKDGAVRDNVRKSWAGVLAKAGITGFRWHDLRHTFASKLVMMGVDLNTVRELLGHADIKMTLRYAHLAPEHKAAAVAMLD